MKKKVHIAREKKKSQGTNRVEITGIVMILLGFFVCLSLGGYGMGIVGNLLRNGFYVLFGVASFGAALVLIFTGAVYVLTCDKYDTSSCFFFNCRMDTSSRLSSSYAPCR